MKTHKTIIITRRMLNKYDPCDPGIAAAEHLLPAKVSTDVEKNFALAQKLTEIEGRRNWADMCSLTGKILGQGCTMWPGTMLCDGDEPGNPQRDMYVIAQQLAAIADAILTSKGR
jgi:hypothetical protein